MGTETTPSFASSSRSKRSFGVNLKRPEGRRAGEAACRDGRRRDREQLDGDHGRPGPGFDELAEVNPRPSTSRASCSVRAGARRAWLGYGPSVQAYGGLTDLWSYADGPPVGGNSNHPDLLVGHLCALVGLAGLLRREHTGDGTHCEVAEVEIVVATLGDLLLAEALNPGSWCGRSATTTSAGAPWGVFRCAGDEEWRASCACATMPTGTCSAANGRPRLGVGRAVEHARGPVRRSRRARRARASRGPPRSPPPRSAPRARRRACRERRCSTRRSSAIRSSRRGRLPRPRAAARRGRVDLRRRVVPCLRHGRPAHRRCAAAR